MFGLCSLNKIQPYITDFYPCNVFFSQCPTLLSVSQVSNTIEKLDYFLKRTIQFIDMDLNLVLRWILNLLVDFRGLLSLFTLNIIINLSQTDDLRNYQLQKSSEIGQEVAHMRQ